MNQAYWRRRERDSIGHARAATLADVKLIHYALADGYSIKAEQAAREQRVSRGLKLKRNLSAQLTTAFPA